MLAFEQGQKKQCTTNTSPICLSSLEEIDHNLLTILLGIFYFQVLQSGELLIKLQNSSYKICHMIVKSLKAPASVLVLGNLQVGSTLKVTFLLIIILLSHSPAKVKGG